MEVNKIYNKDCVEYMKTLQNECVDLIIADPPYYKAINEEWDKIWKSEDEYLKWTEQWFNECVRILKDTGVFYCYGSFDILSKQKVLIFDKQLNFRQNITLSKGIKSIARRTNDKLRMFPTASEYLLYYTKQKNDLVLLEQRNYLLSEWKKSGLTIRQIKEMCGFTGNQPYNWFSPNNKGGGTWQLPKEEHYIKLQSTGFWQKEYKELKEEFLNKRFVFNLQYGITDVWEFNVDKERYGHKTQKPSDITDRIIKSSSNEGQLVYIPFAGSGSEIVSCIKNKRKWIATEINKDYIENIINKRISLLEGF